MQVAIDSATPVDDGGSSGGSFMDNPEPPSYGGYGPMRAYGRMYGSLDFDDVGIWIYHWIILFISYPLDRHAPENDHLHLSK